MGVGILSLLFKFFLVYLLVSFVMMIWRAAKFYLNFKGEIKKAQDQFSAESKSNHHRSYKSNSKDTFEADYKVVEDEES